jgi:hypothetical protein
MNCHGVALRPCVVHLQPPLVQKKKKIQVYNIFVGAVLMLASPHANYITGHTLEVTGGMGI